MLVIIFFLLISLKQCINLPDLITVIRLLGWNVIAESVLPKTDLQHFWVTRVKFVCLKDHRCLQASIMAEISFSRRPLVFYPNFSQTQFLLYFILSRQNLLSISILVIFSSPLIDITVIRRERSRLLKEHENIMKILIHDSSHCPRGHR